ncbi:MAG: 4-hydroxy-tetrahydrodipicolinate reductase [Oscillospiraceae bacterium]|nr:4-hydroxy-tetrahydrodipicolinate reductase [Oscillospiraceae bacterium]
MNIIVTGYTGHMGAILADLIVRGGTHTVAARVSPECPEETGGCYLCLAGYQGPADCVVDFSHHAGTEELLSYCEARRLPVVIATTGQTDAERQRIAEAARTIPVFFSANMSVGVALLVQLARETARMFPDADIEIVESHHNRKLDVPSGTALMLARGIQEVRPEATLNIGRHENGKRTRQEIGIHSLRLGNEVGTHEVIVSTGSQTITLKHEAENRALFAEGALTAAQFLAGKPAGLYNMQDLLQA